MLTIAEAALGADGVDSGDKSSHREQTVQIIEIWGPTDELWEQRELKAINLHMCFTARQLHGGNDRNFQIEQLLSKGMLFANLPSLPPAGPVKFGNQTGSIEQTDLIDPIFITVQSEKAGIRVETKGLDSGQNPIRCQCGERMLGQCQPPHPSLRLKQGRFITGSGILVIAFGTADQGNRKRRDFIAAGDFGDTGFFNLVYSDDRLHRDEATPDAGKF